MAGSYLVDESGAAINSSNPLPVEGLSDANTAIGTTTAAAASANVDEDTTARTVVSLLKGAKNLLIDAVGHLASLVAGTLVRTVNAQVSQTPTVTAGAYSANDAVGGLLTFAGMAQSAAAGGVLKNMVINDDAGQDVALELWLFNQTFTAMADNAAWAPSEADLRNLVAIISTADGNWFAAGTPSVARVETSQAYKCAATSLFGQLVTRGTPTFAATDDVTVTIMSLLD